MEELIERPLQLKQPADVSALMPEWRDATLSTPVS